MKFRSLLPSTTHAVMGPTEWTVLHLVFALTGVLHVVSGALLPALAAALQLSDSQAGRLFFCYFIGTALGALLCTHRHARLIAWGFLSAAAALTLIALVGPGLLWLGFLWMGISMGMPLSSVSILAGRRFGEQSAAPLTLLNFVWSAGALLGPLVAARLLEAHSYRMVYALLALAALVAGLAAQRWILEPPQPAADSPARSATEDRYWILLFCLIAFLVVGIENTSVTWMALYAQRALATNAAAAAAASSLYWGGYLASRAIFSLVLVRVAPLRVLVGSLIASTVAATGLIVLTNAWHSRAAMLVLGISLAPLFPLMLATLFARVQNAAGSRWVLSCSGFGGSLLPWLAGVLSTHTGSLRMGLAIVPLALATLLCLMPLIARQPAVQKRSDSNF